MIADHLLAPHNCGANAPAASLPSRTQQLQNRGEPYWRPPMTCQFDYETIGNSMRNVTDKRQILETGGGLVVSITALPFSSHGNASSMPTEVSFSHSSESATPPRIRFEPPLRWISDLPDPDYTVIQRIPVEFASDADEESIAIFKEANIATSGEDEHDAYRALRYDIMGTFAILMREESNLVTGAKKQLALLRSYIKVSE